MNILFEKIAAFGFDKYPKTKRPTYLISTNLNMFVSYCAVTLFSITILFAVQFEVSILASILICQVLYIGSHILVRVGRYELAKHIFIITSNVTAIYFDHRLGQEYQLSLILFAFLPTAITVFEYPKRKIAIYIYSALPFVTILISRFLSYSLITPFKYHVKSPAFLFIFCLLLSFALFITFAFYIVTVSIVKQKKLYNQRLARQSTLDCLAKVIWTLDTNFNIIVANSKFVSAVHYNFGIPNIGVNSNIKEVGLWDKLPSVLHDLHKQVIGGQRVTVIVDLAGRKNSLSGAPIFDSERKVIGAAFSAADITADIERDKQLVSAKQKAEDASKAKDLFLNNMSHEIRTPLNGIIGITNILKDEVHLPTQGQHLNDLAQLSDHTLELVSNILDFSKMQNGKALLEEKRFNIAEVLQRMESLFKTAAKLRGISFKIVQTGNSFLFLKGDLTRLNQVLINLIGNAIKFTEKGSVILDVEIKEQGIDGKVDCCFSIKDTGIGIKKENIGKVFGAFNQADETISRKFGGTGLGLSICKKLIELMGGDLEIQSVFSIGSCFSFTLPLERSSLTNIHDEDSVLKSTIGLLKGKHILLAEDNKINQMVAKSILDKWNVNLTIVDNGLHVIDALKTKRYDLVLMDLDMPIMDGYEATRIIREVQNQIPVLALTAASFDNMNTILINKGFTGVVIKPFKKEVLYTEMIKQIDYTKKVKEVKHEN